MSALYTLHTHTLRVSVRVCACVLDSFVFKQQVLFRVDFLSVPLDHRVQCPRVGLGSKCRTS